jgi:hypothetical protein
MGTVFNFLIRVLGSGFLSHQGAVTEVQLLGKVDPINMMEQSLDIRVELYQQQNVSMGIQVKKQKYCLKSDMKFQTNVPEPFRAEDEYENNLKEGLPAGLSDSQVNWVNMRIFYFSTFYII